MVVGIVVALVGMSKQKKGSAIGQPMAIIGAILAIGSALWNATSSFGGDNAAMDRERNFVRIEHKMLGKELARQIPGAKKVAVYVDSYNHFDGWGEELDTPRENLGLEGLKEGLGSGVEVVEVYVTPKKYPKPEPQKAPNGELIEPMPPMMDMPMFSPEQLKSCISKAKDADVVVLLGALPPVENSAAMVLRALKGMKVAAVNNIGAEESKVLFENGGKDIADLLCLVTTKRSAVYDDNKAPSNEQKAFDLRYILINKDNYKTAIPAALKAAAK